MTQGFGGYGSYVAPSLARTWGYLHAVAAAPASASDFIRLPDGNLRAPGIAGRDQSRRHL